MLIPTGFWSYTTSDETSARGRLSQLRALLAAELQQQVGRDPKVNIFQDVVAIPPGEEWDAQIRRAIQEASFIIPIVTPGFLQSEWCCREVALFRKREEGLGVKNLVFPFHYVDVDHVIADNERQCHDPAVLAFLRARQWTDFRPLRLRNQEGEDVAILLEGLARGILRALREATVEQERAEAKRRQDEADAMRRSDEKRRDEEARVARESEEAIRRIRAEEETVNNFVALASHGAAWRAREEEERRRREAEAARLAEVRRAREQARAAELAEHIAEKEADRRVRERAARFSSRRAIAGLLVIGITGVLVFGVMRGEEKPDPKTEPLPVQKAVAHPQPAPKAPTAERAFDPTGISKILNSDSPPGAILTGPSVSKAASRGASSGHDTQMSPNLWDALDGLMQDQYKQCWSYLGLTQTKYIPQIKVAYDADGSLASEPTLINRPSDPARRSLAESALRAVKQCNPLKIPPQFAPYYEEWRARVLRFDPAEMAG